MILNEQQLTELHEIKQIILADDFDHDSYMDKLINLSEQNISVEDELKRIYGVVM